MITCIIIHLHFGEDSVLKNLGKPDPFSSPGSATEWSVTWRSDSFPENSVLPFVCK